MRPMHCMVVIMVLCSLSQIVHAQHGTWSLIQNSPYAQERWDAMSFVHPDTGWIAGTRGGMYRTYDGGQSWTELRSAYLVNETWPNGVSREFRSMDFATSKIGWCGVLGEVNPIWRTTDGGDHWMQASDLDTTLVRGVCGLDAVTGTTMYCVGPFSSKIFRGPHITSTHDGGKTYTTTAAPATVSSLVDVSFRTPSIGVIGGGAEGDVKEGFAVVYRSEDSGRTWTQTYRCSVAGTQLWKFHRIADTIIVGSIQMISSTPTDMMIRSDDDGRTWKEHKVDFSDVTKTHSMQAIGFVTPTLGWIGGRGFSSRETTDGGMTWTGVGGPLFQALNRFQFFGDSIGYASGLLVWKYTRNGSTTTVPAQTNNSQPYPVVLTIRDNGLLEVGVPQLFDVRWITVYDAIGRVLRSVESPLRQGGTYPLDCADLPRGPLLVVIGTTTDVLFSTALLE
ncbi:MAG: hypothetical protein JSS89_09395 [Bacteroidetes bacterium]|nr:hypothetical protein [Bacteroidota bacterium]